MSKNLKTITVGDNVYSVPVTDAEEVLATHNSSSDAHSDIRESVTNLETDVTDLQTSVDSLNSNLETNTESINAVSAEFSSLQDNFNNLFVIEKKSITTTSNWAVISKSGYHLIGAYTVIDDNTKGITNIQKRSNTYQYTLIFDGITSSTTLNVHLIWLRI